MKVPLSGVLPTSRSSPSKYVDTPLKSTLTDLSERSFAVNVTLSPTLLPSTSVAAVNSDVGLAIVSAWKSLTSVISVSVVLQKRFAELSI